MTVTVHSVMLAQSYSFNYSILKETVYSVVQFFHHDYRAVNDKHKYLKYFCYKVVKCTSSQQCIDRFICQNVIS